MSLSITKCMNLNRILQLFWDILFAENLVSRLVTERPDDQRRPQAADRWFSALPSFVFQHGLSIICEK